MADFKDLARQYVESDNKAHQNSFAQKAAEQLQGAADGKPALLEWISSVKHWVTFQGEEDDLVSRAKAYEFLADTLQSLNKNFLKADKVGVLINYFKSIFQSDVRGGVRGSVKALSHLMDQEAFKASQGDEILSSLKHLEGDFKLQDAETRAAIYSLVQKIIQREDIANELQYRHGATAGFMTDLIQLVGSERDPKCLYIWFGIIKDFLADYEPSDDVVKVVFDQFSGYYPISLKSDSHPSGLTTDDMKKSLRACFAAHHRVAGLVFPFLLKRLHEGDGVKANIKLDMLQTIKACLMNYTHVAQSIHPFVNDIWTNLKYEVRNGEVEETIEATLDVIYNMAKRLEGAALVDFTLMVQQDCLEDLGNISYAKQAGKLLLAVVGAGPEAFATMASPVVNAVKDHVRRPISQKHTFAVLSLCNSILSLRSVHFQAAQATPESSRAFGANDATFIGLMNDTYQRTYTSMKLNTVIPKDADSIAVATEVVQGLGLLVEQRTPEGLLFTTDTIQGVVNDLRIAWMHFRRDVPSENDVNSTVMEGLTPSLRASLRALTSGICTSLRSCLHAHPPFYSTIMEQCDPFETGSPVENASVRYFGQMASDLAYIFCSKITSPEQGAKRYSEVLTFFLSVFEDFFNKRQHSDYWAYITTHGFSVAIRSFEKACEDFLGHPLKLEDLPSDPRFGWADWVPYIRKRFKLHTIQDEASVQFTEDTGVEHKIDPDREPGDLPDSENAEEQLTVDFLLISLYHVRQLYRKVTYATRADSMSVTMELEEGFTETTTGDEQHQDMFLSRLSEFAETVISKFPEKHQRDLFLADDVIVLFHGNEIFHSERAPHERQEHAANGRQVREAIIVPPDARVDQLLLGERNLRYPPEFPMGDLNNGRTYILSAGIMRALRSHKSAGLPGGFDGAFAPWTPSKIADRILVAGLIARDAATYYTRSEPSLLIMLTTLGNKFNIEKMPGVIKVVRHMTKLLADSSPWYLKDEQYSIFKSYLDEKLPMSRAAKAQEALNPEQGERFVNTKWRQVLARRVLAVLAGLMPRFNTSDMDDTMREIFGHLKLLPGAPKYGYSLARCMALLFSLADNYKTEWHVRVPKFWLQRMYYTVYADMFDKMLPVRQEVIEVDSVGAKDSDTEITDADDAETKDSDIELPDAPDTDPNNSVAARRIKMESEKTLEAAGYSIAVMHMITRLGFETWQQELPRILLMLLCVLKDFPPGSDLAHALKLLETIADKSPRDIGEHINTILGRLPVIIKDAKDEAEVILPSMRPKWMPEDFTDTDHLKQEKIDTRLNIMALLRVLGQKQESTKLQPKKQQVTRLLKNCLGDPVRKVREAAQATLEIWNQN